MRLNDFNFGQAGASGSITNVETLAVTSKPLILPWPTAHVIVLLTLQMSVGAAPGAWTIKLYRGADLTGTLIFTSDAVTGMLANSKAAYTFQFEEDLNGVGQVQYTASATHGTNQAGNTIDTGNILVLVS